jgi:hypothetical protein
MVYSRRHPGVLATQEAESGQNTETLSQKKRRGLLLKRIIRGHREQLCAINSTI